MAASDVVILDEALETGAGQGEVLTLDETGGTVPLPPGAKLQDDGTVLVTLRFPVELKWKSAGASDAEAKAEKYRELVMRRLKGADLERIADTPKGQQARVSIASCVVGINASRFKLIWDRMDGADIQTCAGVVSYFLESGPTTGR